VFVDSSKGSRHDVEREEPDGTKIVAGAMGYMLFRETVMPDFKQEVDGRRVTLNAYRSRLAVSTIDLKFVHRAWETMILSLMGEIIDPAECVNGVYLTDTHSGKSTSLRVEVWFAVRDDKICEAICEEFREEINREMKRLEQTVIFPKFTKMDYFMTKHKVRIFLREAVVI
jgi:hypothetical protein